MVAKKETESFEKLTKIECKITKKGQFNYVSWPDAWDLLKKEHPSATYKVYETEEGFPCFFGANGGMVKVGVTVNKQEHINWMPIIDHGNRSVKNETIDTFQVNKAIQRAFVKAIAMHGLGLYVYRGEDLPTDDDITKSTTQTIAPQLIPSTPAQREAIKKEIGKQHECTKQGCKAQMSNKVKEYSMDKYHRVLCFNCQAIEKKKMEDEALNKLDDQEVEEELV